MRNIGQSLHDRTRRIISRPNSNMESHKAPATDTSRPSSADPPTHDFELSPDPGQPSMSTAGVVASPGPQATSILNISGNTFSEFA